MFIQLLLAIDITEVIGSLVGLALLVAWVVRQIMESNKPAGPPRGRPAAPPQQRGGVHPAGQQADPLRNQVEEFLRRAGRAPQGEQAAGGQRRPRPAAASEVELLVDEEPPAERRPLADPLPRAEASHAAPMQPAAAPRKPRPPRRAAQPRHETVAEHVAESVAAHSRVLIERASRLGQRIIEDDHQFDVQLKAKFDHTVGTLTGSAVAAAQQSAAAAAADNTPAAQIADLLASPEGVRQAIVINEILRRPIDRW